MMKLLKTKTAQTGALVLALAAPLMANAQTNAIPDASAQIAAVTTGQAGYSTVMFALALAAVGIMVGVKWIKRAKGAA